MHTGMKKNPMCTVKYTAGSLMLWAYFSAGGPGHVVQIHDIMDSIKYQQIKKKKNLNLTASAYNGVMGHVWILHQVKDPKQALKPTQKCVTKTEHKMRLLPCPSQFSDLNPIENECGEPRKRTNII